MTNHSYLDQLKRPMRDLRISVIDRCNFRCPYCMPSSQYSRKYHFLDKRDWLTFGEITRLVKLFTQLGVYKIRLTGGEPLLRPNLDQLIQMLHSTDGVNDLALTTNASLLYGQAEILKNAGLNRITVSLDSLDNKTFGIMSGEKGILKDVKEGIREAARAGFRSIKLNCVIQKGVNEDSILPIVDYARQHHHIVRFIEYMDVGTCNNWDPNQVMPSKDIVALINEAYRIEPAEANYYGEVAKRYRFKDGKGEVGFISSVTQPFCGSCTRARLSTDGKLYTCLFAKYGADLRTPLREGATDTELLHIIQSVWATRHAQYFEDRHAIRNKGGNTEKVEMFHIGG